MQASREDAAAGTMFSGLCALAISASDGVANNGTVNNGTRALRIR